MRLKILNKRPNSRNMVKLIGMRLLFGKVPDAAKAAFYRPEIATRPFFTLQHEVLRGSSKDWTVGERELIVAFISSKNRCDYCTIAHSAFAVKSFENPAWVQSIVENLEVAQVTPKLKTMLKFLEKLSLYPWEVSNQDIEDLRSAGLGDSAIEEAVMVCVVFAIGNRVANTLDFERPKEQYLRRAVPFVLRFGYKAYIG